MPKDFDGWNEIKKQVHHGDFTDFVHTREVWWTSVGVNVGFEQDGKHRPFERPALVLKKFNRDVVLIVPLTTKLKNKPYNIPFTHKENEYSALISQIRLISTKRLQRRMYRMDGKLFERIRNAVKEML